MTAQTLNCAWQKTDIMAVNVVKISANLASRSASEDSRRARWTLTSVNVRHTGSWSPIFGQIWPKIHNFDNSPVIPSPSEVFVDWFLFNKTFIFSSEQKPNKWGSKWKLRAWLIWFLESFVWPWKVLFFPRQYLTGCKTIYLQALTSQQKTMLFPVFTPTSSLTPSRRGRHSGQRGRHPEW